MSSQSQKTALYRAPLVSSQSPSQELPLFQEPPSFQDTAQDTAQDTTEPARLDDLEKALRRIANFCRRTKGDAQLFQNMMQAFQEEGLAGADRVMAAHNRRYRLVSEAEKAHIRRLALAHPTWGQVRLAAALAEEGVPISAAVVHRVLGELELGGFHARGYVLEQAYSAGTVTLSPEQSHFLGAINPCFRDRHLMSSGPGQVIDVDSFFIGCLRGTTTKIYVHAAVDVFSSYAFAFLHTSSSPDVAVAVLHHYVFPFFQRHECPVHVVHTKKGRLFTGGTHHHYRMYLKLRAVAHKTTGTSQSGGFVECFRVAVRDEFFKMLPEWSPDTTLPPVTLPTMRAHFATWLGVYNHKRPIAGYPNNGMPPVVRLPSSARALAQEGGDRPRESSGDQSDVGTVCSSSLQGVMPL